MLAARTAGRSRDRNRKPSDENLRPRVHAGADRDRRCRYRLRRPNFGRAWSPESTSISKAIIQAVGPQNRGPGSDAIGGNWPAPCRRRRQTDAASLTRECALTRTRKANFNGSCGSNIAFPLRSGERPESLSLACTGVFPKSSSQQTRRWREADSNPLGPPVWRPM
jgi:hypothetical protein